MSLGLCCCVLLDISFCHWDHAFFFIRIVKLASPNLNYILLTGSVLLYSSALVYEYSVDSFNEAAKFTVICNVSGS